MKRQVGILLSLDQRGVWSYQSTLISRTSFFSQWYFPSSEPENENENENENL